MASIYLANQLGFAGCHVHRSQVTITCHRYLVSCVTRLGIQSRFRLLVILSYTCINHNHVCLCESHCTSHSGTPVYIVTIGQCPLWVLTQVWREPSRHPYIRTLTHPFTSHLECVWLLVLLGSECLDYSYWREEIRPFILVMGGAMVLRPVATFVSWTQLPKISESAL